MDAVDHEAVLRRAIALERHGELDPANELTEATITETARELDIGVAHVAQALAEARAGVDDDIGFLDRVVGPTLAAGAAVVDHENDELVEVVEEWLEHGHGLRTRRTGEGLVVANKRTDPIGRVVRASLSIGGLGGLGRMTEVRASAVRLSDASAVCFTADLKDKRRESMAVGAVVGAGSGLVVGVAALAATPIAIAIVPVGLGAAVITTRGRHRATVRRVTNDLETAAAGAVRGRRPPTAGAKLRKKLMRRQGLSEG